MIVSSSVKDPLWKCVWISLCSGTEGTQGAIMIMMSTRTWTEKSKAINGSEFVTWFWLLCCLNHPVLFGSLSLRKVCSLNARGCYRSAISIWISIWERGFFHPLDGTLPDTNVLPPKFTTKISPGESIPILYFYLQNCKYRSSWELEANSNWQLGLRQNLQPNSTRQVVLADHMTLLAH